MTHEASGIDLAIAGLGAGATLLAAAAAIGSWRAARQANQIAERSDAAMRDAMLRPERKAFLETLYAFSYVVKRGGDASDVKTERRRWELVEPGGAALFDAMVWDAIQGLASATMKTVGERYNAVDWEPSAQEQEVVEERLRQLTRERYGI